MILNELQNSLNLQGTNGFGPEALVKGFKRRLKKDYLDFEKMQSEAS
jgi:hypothetical protein